MAGSIGQVWQLCYWLTDRSLEIRYGVFLAGDASRLSNNSDSSVPHGLSRPSRVAGAPTRNEIESLERPGRILELTRPHTRVGET
jgi:hypothetical protein